LPGDDPLLEPPLPAPTPPVAPGDPPPPPQATSAIVIKAPVLRRTSVVNEKFRKLNAMSLS
jgi:hypothetical protein